ncbi:hypothetical protein D9M69_641200 [compost metagenome]
MAVTSSQKFLSNAAQAHSSAEASATSSPIWNEPLRPNALWVRATSGVDKAPPTT